MSATEEMLQCPYNSYHLILKSRFPAHLCKCRKQYTGKDYALCPFNATHNVLRPELQYHIENCPDRIKLDSYVYVVADQGKSNELPSLEIPDGTEVWDELPSAKTSYLDTKDNLVKDVPLLRVPYGKSKAQRKKFLGDQMQLFVGLSDGKVLDPAPSESKVEGTSSKGSARVVNEIGRGEVATVSDDDEDSFAIVVKNKGRGRAIPS